MPRNSREYGSTVSRRKLMSGIGTAAVAGLAGCPSGGGGSGDGGGGDGGSGDGGGGGGGGGELGERVPTVTMRWWTGLGGISSIQEQAVPIIQESLTQGLNLDLETSATDAITSWTDMINDQRNAALVFTHHGNTMARLDPNEQIRRIAADFAGADQGPNPQNYANCEYSELAVAQAEATSESERRDIVNQAQSIVSGGDAAMGIPMYPTPMIGAYRTDAVEIGGVGQGGIDPTNPNVLVKSSLTDGDTLNVNVQPDLVRRLNYLTMSNRDQMPLMVQLLHSPLTAYDENFELQFVLAEDIDVADDGKRFTISLRDATFHNGDPITAEHVKFTLETIQNNVGVYPQPHKLPYDSFNIIDDKTLEVTTTEPFLALITSEWTRWGILHKDTWVDAGIQDPPEDRDLQFDVDNYVGSGPFELADFRSEQSMTLTPADSHPVADVPDHDIIMRAMGNVSTALEAFRADEIQMIYQIGPGQADELQQNMDAAEVIFGQGHQTNLIYPQFPIAPTKFHEFRDAVGMAIDRQTVTDVAVRGEAEPDMYSSFWAKGHPWRAPDDMLHQFTDQASGDPEAAKQALRDAGWGWDDNGNLHYPPDADLEPLWPKGEAPSPEDFPCLEDLG